MGTYEATVEGVFKARHAVRTPGGAWEQPHEHLWAVAATFRSARLDPATGVVIDFVEVQGALASITAGLEGSDLNGIAAFAGGGASAERVAGHLAGLLAAALGKGGAKLYRLAVTEASGCSAAYYPRQVGLDGGGRRS